MDKNQLLRKKFRPVEWIAEKAITATAFVSLTFIALIFVFVFREAMPLFKDRSHEIAVRNAAPIEEVETYGEDMVGAGSSSVSTTSPTKNSEMAAAAYVSKASDMLAKDWQPVSDQPKYGLWPLFAGSFKVTLIAILLAAPIAILSALYTNTFAPKWCKELMKPTIEILSGFPSVVIGFFALTVLASAMQILFGFEYRLNSFVGGVAMSLAVIPIIFTISEDALSAVPKSLSEASLALGAKRWETALYIILPAATPGVFAAILLGFGRAFGETMIVLMATGNAALLSFDFTEPVRTLSATIGAEMAEVVFGEFHYNVLFAIGILLFLFSFGINLIAEFYIRQKLMKKFRGA